MQRAALSTQLCLWRSGNTYKFTSRNTFFSGVAQHSIGSTTFPVKLLSLVYMYMHTFNNKGNGTFKIKEITLYCDFPQNLNKQWAHVWHTVFLRLFGWYTCVWISHRPHVGQSGARKDRGVVNAQDGIIRLILWQSDMERRKIKWYKWKRKKIVSRCV